MQPFDVTIPITLQAEDADAIVLATTPGVGEIPLTGTLLKGDQAVIPNPAYLILTPAADESANSFTVTGLDVNDQIVSTTFDGDNATPVIVEVAYKTVTSFSCAQPCNGNIQLGITTQTTSAWIPLDGVRDFLSVTGAALFSEGATATATLEYGFFSTPYKTSTPLVGTVEDTILVSKSSNTATPINNPADAIRLKIPSWTDGTVYFCVRQANAGHASPGG